MEEASDTLEGKSLFRLVDRVWSGSQGDPESEHWPLIGGVDDFVQKNATGVFDELEGREVVGFAAHEAMVVPDVFEELSACGEELGGKPSFPVGRSDSVAKMATDFAKRFVQLMTDAAAPDDDAIEESIERGVGNASRVQITTVMFVVEERHGPLLFEEAFSWIECQPDDDGERIQSGGNVEEGVGGSEPPGEGRESQTGDEGSNVSGHVHCSGD